MIAVIDAARLVTVQPDWYIFLESVRMHYSQNPNIFGYGIGPGRRNESDSDGDVKGHPEVFIQQSLNRAAVFVPQSISFWTSFIDWLHRNRADWFLWPTLRGVHKKGDSKLAKVNSTVQASWQSWLTKYAAIHDVYIVHHHSVDFKWAPQNTFNISQSGKRIRRLLLNGTIGGFDQQNSRISANSIHSITQIAKQNSNFVSLTIVNTAFLETARSWLCNVDTGGFRPPGIVWLATDRESFSELSRIPMTHTIFMNDMQGGRTRSAFGNPSYWLLMLERTNLLRDLLNRGCTVFSLRNRSSMVEGSNASRE